VPYRSPRRARSLRARTIWPSLGGLTLISIRAASAWTMGLYSKFHANQGMKMLTDYKSLTYNDLHNTSAPGTWGRCCIFHALSGRQTAR
jgi:hypothetical protein